MRSPAHSARLPLGAAPSRSELRHAAASGRVRRPVRGTYVRADVKSPWSRDYYAHPGADALWQGLTAAAAVLPPGAALADESAAYVWCGWWPRTPTPSMVVPHGTVPLRREGLRCRGAALPAGDIVLVSHLPVTSAQRTAIDLARNLPRPWAVAAVDALLHAHLVGPELLGSGLRAVPGGRGVRQAREVIALADAGAASPGESLTRLYLLDAGLGPVRTQVAFVGGRYVVDLLVRGKLIIEFEGRRHDEADHFVADRRRFNALSQLPGMAVLRLTWADLRDPAALVAQVRAALRQLGEDV
ncbi:MAG TPA: DUF559 domain-containing protein [Mycobacteriales bacterium]|nr:DUF559 domain-containing protein [Mycobacteriales bacterium]